MKRLVLILCFFLGVSVVIQAQFLEKPNGEVGASSADVPIAEGFFVVSAVAAAYAYLRKGKED